MVFMYAALVVSIVLLCAVFLGRFAAWIIELVAHYVLHLDLCISHFGFLSVNGIKVKIKNNTLCIRIDRISLQPKWTFPNNSKKLFSVLLSGISVTLEPRHGDVHHSTKKSTPKSGNSLLSSHKEKISSFVTKVCQYVGIFVSDLEVSLLLENRLVHCKLQDGLEVFANPAGKRLQTVVSGCKVITQYSEIDSRSIEDVEHLAELSVSVDVEANIELFDTLSLAILQVRLKSLGVLLSDALLINNVSLQSTDTPQFEGEVTSEDSLDAEEKSSALTGNTIWAKLSKIPKQVELVVDESSVTLLNQEKKRITLELSRIVGSISKEQNDALSSCAINIGVSGVSLSGVKPCKLCILNRFRLGAKLSDLNGESQLSSSLSIESLHNNYIHQECSYWLEYFKSRMKNRRTIVSNAPTHTKRSPPILLGVPVTVDVEMVDCSTSLFLKLPSRHQEPLFRAVLASCTLTANVPLQDPKQITRETHEISVIFRLENAYVYVNTAEGAAEPVDSGITCYTLPDDPGVLPTSHRHVWGRVLALGSCSVKGSSNALSAENEAIHLTTKADVSCLAVEWSHQVCRTVLRVAERFSGDSPSPTDERTTSEPTSSERTGKVVTDTEMRICGINVFYLGTRGEGLDSFVMRTDMVTIATQPDNAVHAEVCGVKVARMLGLEKLPYRCIQSNEFEGHCLSLPVLSVAVSRTKELSVTLGEVDIEWCPTFHMALNERIQEVTKDAKNVTALIKSHQASHPLAPPQATRSTLPVQLQVCRFKLKMQTSPTTSFGVELSSTLVQLQENALSAQVGTAAVLFDGNRIVTCETASFSRLQEVAEVLTTRVGFTNLQTAGNQTWIVSAEATRVVFPHEFDFAVSRSELVNIVKMLKALHKKPRGPDYMEPLPPDLWLRFESIIFEIEDDPFEVKLGDNYALLLDEARQWGARRTTLETRLNEIRKTPGNLLTVRKEDELYSKLEEKNAQIYIRRSKALYEQMPMRKSLLTWEFVGVDMVVLADESYHGKDRAVEMMCRLNHDSPYPSSGLEFTTLWCRTVQGSLQSHCCRLRDYPRPMFTSTSVTVRGTVMGAEQAAAERATRQSIVHVDDPWEDITVQRSLTAFKFYYDLDFDVDTLEMAWGVDTDPATTMVSLAFDYVSKASADPSKPLPFFDKIRLLMHGRLHLKMKEWLMFFSATRNPYDIAERLEVEWRDCEVMWTNGRIVIDGDFDLQTRTASKYDDRRVLHLPSFKVCADMKWLCQGDPNDHHTIMPCAPEKIPELAPNQAHDSYAAFRSQNLLLDLSLETAMKKSNQVDPPTVFLYASTFRWFKKYQAVVLQSVSRPIKRGPYFGRPIVKKQALGRHYKKVSLALRFPALSVWYWGSFTQQRGVALSCGEGSLHTQYRLQLKSISDGLIRREAADWSPTKLHIEMSDVISHVYGLEQADGQEEGEEASEVSSIDLEPTKYYFLTAESLVYSRQDTTKKPKKDPEDMTEQQVYGHRLVCHGLKGAWSLTSRRILFGLFEAYTNAEILKKNLSADALKVTIVEQKKTKQGESSHSSTSQSRSKSRSMSLLQKLVSERDSKFTVYTEEGSDTVDQTDIPLQGVTMCNTDDVIAHSWHIKLVNSQIMLKGNESTGCVLVTAGSTTVVSKLRQPVWDKGELFNKNTWSGTVDNLQYFATVSTGDTVSLDSIPWLDTTVITGRQPQKAGYGIAELADIVGSGEAVGGVITSVVGGATAGSGQDMPQLQRIVARCGCEFYYVNFSTELDPLAQQMATSNVPQSPASSHLRVGRQEIVNTFTIRHKLLEISTNSSQYAMLIDIVNNVVLYTEPKKKEAINKLQRRRFHLQLSASEDQRGQILSLQNVVRSRQTEMRSLQRELYEVNLLRKNTVDNQDAVTEAVIMLEREIAQKKELLNSSSSELKLMISAYKDFQLNLNKPTPEKAPSAEPKQLAEVHFNHVSWQLNQADGQLEIADVKFRDFSYSKTTLSDATIEHRFEVGRCNMRNLLPNSIYKDVLSPNDVIGSTGRGLMVRLYCRVKPPVGGIGVKEHFEVNVCPLTVQLTYRLFRKVMKFFFPKRAEEYGGEVGEVDLVYRGQEPDEKDFEDGDMYTDDLEELNLQLPPRSSSLRRSVSSVSSVSSSSSETSTDFPSKRRSVMSISSTGESPPTSPLSKDKGKKKSTFYRNLEEYDDLEKMKERASKNNSFIYVKVTEVALCVSYKGEKEKNIVDVRDFNLTIPTLEYHNRTWTWHDLLMAMKKDCINVLVSQVIKEKLHWKGGHGGEVTDTKAETKEEDKAKLLFGDRSKAEKKKNKKGLLRKLVKRRNASKQAGLLQPDGAGPEPVNLEEEEFEGDEEEGEELADDDTATEQRD